VVMQRDLSASPFSSFLFIVCMHVNPERKIDAHVAQGSYV
jgi:hypothetical protein